MNKPDRQQILSSLKKLNEKYASKGFRFVGLFGSYARNDAGDFSDIDIAYRIDHAKFHPDNAFKKLEAIQEIRRELEKIFKRKVDLIPYPKEDSPLKERLQKELLSA